MRIAVWPCFFSRCHKPNRFGSKGLKQAKPTVCWAQISIIGVEFPHQAWSPVCVCDRYIFVCPSSGLWVSAEWVLESHGHLSAGWRRKHNPEKEGCCYQSVHVGQREHSAWLEADRLKLTLHISNLFLLSPYLCFLSLFVFCPALWPAPGLSSRHSSELHYNVWGGFSAVSTQR